MRYLHKLLFSLLCCLPLAAGAAVSDGDLPAGTIWYLHANLATMRDAPGGNALYGWLDDEVFMEIHEDIGIDIDQEIDSVTAFSSTLGNAVILVEGDISKATQEKILAIAAVEAQLEAREHDGKAYHKVWGSRNEDDDRSDDNPFVDLDEQAFFSFAERGKLIVTSTEDELRAMLESGGKIVGSGNREGTIFVLTADKAFVQAGLNTDSLGEDDDAWKSNVIRNTEQAALLVSGVDELIAVEAQLVSTDATIAQSLGGIVNGLIGLQAFNEELQPEIRTLINNTKVRVKENVLSISTVLDPELVVTALKD